MSDTDAEDSGPATGTTDENADEGLEESEPEKSDPTASSDAADVSSEDVDGDSGSASGEQHDPEDKSDLDVYVDRDKIDFDPDDGLLTGTAIDGGTDIPGPHEIVDDVAPDEDGSEDSEAGEGSDSEGSDSDGSGTDGSDD